MKDFYKVMAIIGGIRCPASRICGRQEAHMIGTRLAALLTDARIIIVEYGNNH